MDRDPELDVMLSNGRRVVHVQIAAVDPELGIWAVSEPGCPRRVIFGVTEALATRSRVDACIARHLDAGWVPVERAPAATPVAWPPMLAQDLSYLVATIGESADALRAVDPTGQLWAACVILRREVRRCGVAEPLTRRARALRERRLGELAEQAGEIPSAIVHYRAALVLVRGIGVRRRIAQLEALVGGSDPRPPRNRRRR